MTIHDPIVEDVIKARQRIYDKFGGDMDKYIAHIKAAEEKGRAEGRVYLTKEDLTASRDKGQPTRSK